MPNPPTLTPLMNADEVNALMTSVYPQLNEAQSAYYTVEITPGACLVRLDADERHLRPGDTVSGPSLFTLADIAGYVAVFSHVGPEALAVTTNLNINFMRKAGPGAVDGHCRILKLGKRLLVFEVAMMSGGEMVAHATGTYAIPPKRSS